MQTQKLIKLIWIQMMKCLKIFISLMMIAAYSPKAFAQQFCTDGRLDRAVEGKRGLYIGELHGSNEMPDFYLCLVEYFIRKPTGRVLVASLELPESARDSEAQFWRNQDGRASQRMFALVNTLLRYERENKLIVHFQYKDKVDLRENEKNPTPDQLIYESLVEAQKQGFVLAFGGNVHNMKTLPLGLPKTLITAGMKLGDTWVSVRLASTMSGEIWACTPGRPCGLTPIPPSKKQDIELFRFVEDENRHHDFVWFLTSLSASQPYSSEMRTIEH